MQKQQHSASSIQS